MKFFKKIYIKIYMTIFSQYLGKAIISLNEIEHRILNHGMYFLVYSVYGQGVTDFHEKVAKRTMGTKVGWLQMLAKGETEASKIPPETNDLKRLTDAQMFVSTQAMMEIIDTLDTLIKDKRNPLVHSTYYYRVDKWNMSVSQTHNLNFKQIGIMDMRKYSKEIEVIKENLIQLLYFKAMDVHRPGG